MTQDVLVDIMETCKRIDVLAAKMYHHMGSVFQDHEVAHFWQQMAEEEREHVEFWNGLLDLARTASLPQVFASPHQVLEELEASNDKIAWIYESCCQANNLNHAFVAAYWMEFYLLHPAFEALFSYGASLDHVLRSQSPAKKYAEHIQGFIQALERWGNTTPEMELVGQSLIRLWHDNRLLSRLSVTDELTGLLNRRGFHQAIEPLANLAKRQGSPAAFIFIDLDEFKAINDSHGHQLGDRVLAQVAGLIKEHSRASDIVGRYGGEEFISFIWPARPDQLKAMGQRINQAVAQAEPEGVPCSVSIGISYGLVTGDVDQCLRELIRRADDAMYQAKQTGKNRLVWHSAQPHI